MGQWGNGDVGRSGFELRLLRRVMTTRVIAFLMCGAALSAQQSAQPAVMTGTGAISGVVTDAITGAPLEGVLVQLGGGNAYNIPDRARQVTDARGRYAFTQLPPRTMYLIIAAKVGYFDGGHGWRPGTQGGPRIELVDGQSRPDVDVKMWKPASISGVVVDERGEPVVGTAVQVLERLTVPGRQVWGTGPYSTTDDRGVYRIAGLARGEYLIHVPSVQITVPSGDPLLGPAQSASTGIRSLVQRAADGPGVVVGHFATPSPDARGRAYPMMYHPSARSVDAAVPVRVDFGDRRAGVDVQLVLEPTVRISGRVVGPAEALVRLPLRLLPMGDENPGAGGEAALTQTDTTGAFTFLNVPRGQYVLVAARSYATYSTVTNVTRQIMPEGGDPFSSSLSNSRVAGHETAVVNLRSTGGQPAHGRLVVNVGDEDISGLTLPVSPGVTVSGHYLWDGSRMSPASLRIAPILRLDSADGDVRITPRTGELGAARTMTTPAPVTFTIEGVQPGRYVFAPLLGGTTSVETIEWNGRNLLDTPLDVTGDRPITDVVIGLTSTPAGAEGNVRDKSGNPAKSAVVALFPAAPAAWTTLGLSAIRFKTTTVGAAGAYRITAVPPGDYYLAALPDTERYRVFDAAVLPSLVSTATRVTITRGATVRQDLELAGGVR